MTSDLLTPELIEKVAKVLFVHEWNLAEVPPRTFEGNWVDGGKKYWMACACAALEAALPDIVEKCAAVPRKMIETIDWDTQHDNGIMLLEDVEDAIRSLNKQPAKHSERV